MRFILGLSIAWCVGHFWAGNLTAYGVFMGGQVAAHTPPGEILSDVAAVLDDEAEMFVMKMWRLVIYETEHKRIGV